MSNPIFLDIEQVLTILLGELPNGVYSTDRADSTDVNKRSYSSSEIRAHAQVYANLYANLQDIYQNKFITTVQPDEISAWEAELFPTPQNAALPFDTRKMNLLTKYRATGGISYLYIYNLVSSVLTPLGLPFIIEVFCGMPQGAWHLDISALDFDTYIADTDPLYGKQVGLYNLDCNFAIDTTGDMTVTSAVISNMVAEDTARIQVGAGITGPGIPMGTTILSVSTHSVTMSNAATLTTDAAAIQIQNYIAAGLTAAQLLGIQTTAYTYAVYIFGNANAQTLSTLDAVLTQAEPGGSTHIFVNNAVPPIDPNILDLGGGSECVLVDAYDCGNEFLGATYNVWDFEILTG